MRILAALLLIGLAFEASATELKNIKATVQLQDKATNGCWTNLKETREYAARNLRMKAFRLATLMFQIFSPTNFGFGLR